MAKVVWTEPALSDLNEIAEYISLDNFRAAQNLIKKVFSTTDLLESSPEMGRRPPELPHTSYKKLIVAPCRIFYRIHDDETIIYIIFVMRSERSLNQYLLDQRQPDIL